ncbi:MAG TPA: hypothetical protein VMV74_01745, partial [Bacteroidales bacterium]|nr:hypothetical protein [Bacteroidales bacterium]
MKRINFLFLAVMALVIASCGNKGPQPPVALKKVYTIESNGNTRNDDYFWMRLSDEQKNAETPDPQTVDVLNYLNAENDYAKAMMKHTEAFQTTLFEEMKGRIKENDETVPYLNNGYYYNTKYFEGKEYPVFYRIKEGAEQAEVMLDVNTLAEGFKYTGVGRTSVSRSNDLLAYGVDHVSRRQYTVFFKDLNSGELLPDSVVNTTGQTEWADDNKTVFYVQKDPETLRAAKVMKHVLGTPVTEDKMVYDETDETFAVYISKTKSKKYITLVSGQTLTTEIRLIEASNPDGIPVVFEPRKVDHLYSLDHLNGEFYILTNAD